MKSAKAFLFCALLFIGRAAAGQLPYPLSTNGNQIVDQNGNSVRLSCVGWAWYGSNGSPPNGLDSYSYKMILQAVIDGGINCVRFTTCDVDVLNNPSITSVSQQQNPDIYGMNYNQMLQAIVNYGGSIGLKFIIESHNNEGGNSPNYGAQQMNGLWYDVGGTSDGTDGGGQVGHVSDETFLQLWQTRAQLFAGNSAVIGYDIRNEPLAYGGMCTWGDGGTNDIMAMYTRVGNAIQGIDSNPLIICEGPQNYNQMFYSNGPAPWGDLSGVQNYPVKLNNPNKVVYSVHVYPTGVSGFSPDNGSDVVNLYNNDWGYVATQNLAPLWIGEMGDNMQSQDDVNYIETLISYFNGNEGGNGGPTFGNGQEGISWSWWALQAVGPNYPNGAPNFGILNTSWNGMDENQQQYWSQIL